MSFIINKKSNYKIFNLISILLLSAIMGCGGGDSDSSVSTSGSVDGQGGSMARFSLIGDYLYTISGSDLQLFNLKTNPAEPTPFNKVPVSWAIETLYSSGNYLFIGAENGVYIFDNTDPSNPQQISQFLHVRSFDPVVVSGQYAYVTLRTGPGRRGAGANRMDILDMSDIKNPTLVKTYAMQNPKGLGVANGQLFVCDDIAGLKTYDLADPVNPQLTATDVSINCYDLIPYTKSNTTSNNSENKNQTGVTTNNLVISDNTGILQFQYDFAGLTKISEIIANTPNATQ